MNYSLDESKWNGKSICCTHLSIQDDMENANRSLKFNLNGQLHSNYPVGHVNLEYDTLRLAVSIFCLWL